VAGLVILEVKVTTAMLTQILVGEVEVVLVVAIKMTVRLWGCRFGSSGFGNWIKNVRPSNVILDERYYFCGRKQ